MKCSFNGCGNEFIGQGYCLKHGGVRRARRDGKRYEAEVLEKIVSLGRFNGRLTPEDRAECVETAQLLGDALKQLKDFAARTGLVYTRTVHVAEKALKAGRDNGRTPDFRKANMGIAGGKPSGKTARKRARAKLAQSIPLTREETALVRPYLTAAELERAEELKLLRS